MRRERVVLLLLAFVVGCGAPPPRLEVPVEDRVGTAAAPKRITAVIRGTPLSLSMHKGQREGGGIAPGLDAIEELVHAGLTQVDNRGNRHAQLAEIVPSIENGLWRVAPDGRMEITWQIKAASRWHDGTPLTTADLLFAVDVERDKEVALPNNAVYDYVETFEALDSRTVKVLWREPYIEADALFSVLAGLPMPRHLLEKAFLENKASFLGLPYWSQEFVGAGPYRMREWVADSHVVVQRFDDYVLGRPSIHEIEIKFIPDPNTMVANVLSGVVDLNLGRSLLPVDQARHIQERRPDIKIGTTYRSWYPIHSQFVNTHPPIVLDVRFRRALLHAIDRQELVDTFSLGLSAIAHTFVGSQTAEYKEIEPSIIRYEYDPRKTAQMIEGLGYAKRADGFFYDAAGQKLTVELRTTARAEIQPKIILAAADYWERAGVAVEPVMIPIRLMTDREYRAAFPAFEMPGGGNAVTAEGVRRYHSTQAPLPENRFQVGGNIARYRNAELDALIERFLVTIPRPDRMQVLAQIVRHQTDQLPTLGLFYQVDSTVFSEKVRNVSPRGEIATQAWNVHTWEAL